MKTEMKKDYEDTSGEEFKAEPPKFLGMDYFRVIYMGLSLLILLMAVVYFMVEDEKMYFFFCKF